MYRFKNSSKTLVGLAFCIGVIALGYPQSSFGQKSGGQPPASSTASPQNVNVVNTPTVTLTPGTTVSVSGTAIGQAVPHFKDYPAGEIYKGATAPLVLTKDDLTFKTRLREAAKNEKPNFAGHYILTIWGCGAECLMGAAIDAKTGRVYWWNFSLCCWDSGTDDNFNPIEFRPDSRLIVFSGLRDEKDGDNGAHFYRFDDGRFVHIRSVLKPNQ